MPRTDYQYLRRLTLIPAYHRVLPGQSVVLVEVQPIGPIAMWPRGANGPETRWGIHPDIAPTQIPQLQIVAASDEPYTVQPGEVWIAPDPAGGFLPRSHPAAGAGHFALLDDDGRRW